MKPEEFDEFAKSVCEFRDAFLSYVPDPMTCNDMSEVHVMFEYSPPNTTANLTEEQRKKL